MGDGRPRLPHARAARGTRRLARRRRRGAAAPREIAGPPALRLRDLRGVGPEVERKLAALDVRTPGDLAAIFPRDYRDWRVPSSAAELAFALAQRVPLPGEPEGVDAIALGTVARTSEYHGRVAVVTADLDDDTGRIRATWFGRRGLAGALAEGARVFVQGRATLKRARGALAVEINVLHHEVLAPGAVYAGEIVPVYRATKELTSRQIGALIARNADALAALVPEPLPPPVLAARGYGAARDAWREMHRPRTPESAAAARERLVYEEFFGMALAAARLRADRAAAGGAVAMPADAGLLERFAATLPFAFTRAQRRAIEELWRDMGSAAPMNRLLQGDVGSGKTLVAAAAVVLAASRGMQSALMAPTEILAMQHARKLAPLLLPLGVRVDALTGGLGARERAAARARIASGECDLVVGTHALIEDDVAFRALGLAVIDEQHRFGVAQRAKLRAKGAAPHTLHMTATPIPRTLAQTKFADLDVTVLDELPPGRTPVDTRIIRESAKDRAYEFVCRSVALGRQAYVVAPAIEESEAALTSAVAELERVRAFVEGWSRQLDLGVDGSSARGGRVPVVALLHGRMPQREKDATMRAFTSGEVDVLLATTVVEVGVDVPNATVMVILDAHRFGLAQLHQLRGRVGRGAEKSYCLLVAPNGRASGPRLEVLVETNDGFRIAEEDLALRRAGELAGTSQTGGGPELLGDLADDFALYTVAKADADALVAADPALAAPEHAALRAWSDGARSARAALASA